MHTPIFQLSGIGFTYPPDIPALADLNLQVQAGEQLVILGANGCGKTTLLRLLGGLIFPERGELRAFDEPLTEDKLETDTFRAFFRSRVGFVFQNPEVQLFCPTVYDELAFGPLQLGLPEDGVKRRVEDLLEMLGITPLQARAPHHLSGGEKKKVAIASVLAMNPQVLLLDEPTTGLDPRTQGWLMELIMELGAAGKTVITTTHDLAMVKKIATRVVVIGEDHRLAADGTPAEILSDTALLLRANLIRETDAHQLQGRHLSRPKKDEPPVTPSPYPFTADCKKRH